MTSNDVLDFLTDVRFADLSGFWLVADGVDREELFSTVRKAGCDRAIGALGDETVSITLLRPVGAASEVLDLADTDGVITVRETDDVFGFDSAFLAEETEEAREELSTRIALLLFLSAVLTTSTVRFTRRAGIALLLCGAGCEGVC